MDDHAYPAVNIAGFIAFGVPVLLTLMSLVTDTMNWFYDYGWFTGSALGSHRLLRGEPSVVIVATGWAGTHHGA